MNRRLLAFLSVVLFLLPGVASAAPGDLDDSFGHGGTAMADVSVFDEVTDIAVAPDGAIIAVGRASDSSGSLFVLAKFHPDGTLDVGFGHNGIVVEWLLGSAEAEAVVLQPDGRILVAGSAGVQNLDFVVARYEPSGSRDMTFGASGVTLTDFGGHDRAHALVVQPDGKLVVVGETSANEDMAVARLRPDGSLDDSFGAGGKVTTDFGSYAAAHSVVSDSDGSLVVGGTVLSFPPPAISIAERTTAGFGSSPQPNAALALARYRPDGALDASFAGDGTVTWHPEGGDFFLAELEIQPDGRLVAAGRANFAFELARFQRDGRLDMQFGEGGFVRTPLGQFASAAAAALQQDGKIVVAGEAGSDLAVVRHKSDGTLDAGFGQGGVVRTDLGAYERAGAVAIQPDGKIVAGGIAGRTRRGYWILAERGGVVTLGEAPGFGLLALPPEWFPHVAIAADPSGRGYMVASSNGRVLTQGQARWWGDLREIPLAAPIVGIATPPFSEGYWIAGRDGGIFAFGRQFWGSMGGVALNSPIVDIESQSSLGYWLAGGDGGVFAFGDAEFFGSTGDLPLNAPIMGMAATPTRGGYWLVASDGGVFAFGDAGFFGSTAELPLNAPIVAIASTPTGKGYWLVASDGGVFAFGDADFLGSAVGSDVPGPFVDLAHGYRSDSDFLVARYLP